MYRTLTAISFITALIFLQQSTAHASEVGGTLTTTIPAVVTVTPPVTSGGGDTTYKRQSRRNGGSIIEDEATSTPVSVGVVLGASTFKFTRNLTGGLMGEDVYVLQDILIKAGHLVIPAPTSYFGPFTRAGVVLFQLAHGLPGVGHVGPLTRGVLNSQPAAVSLP